MFISEKFNFVYFEVPRTGSNAITKALTKLDPESPTVQQRKETHKMDEYHYFSIPEKSDNQTSPYIVIAAHRNPYQRVWSFWKHRHYYGNPAIFRSTSWPRYLKWVCEPESVPEITGALLDVPITEMFDCDSVSYWLDFENLHESWQGLAKQYQLNLKTLEIDNASRYLGEFSQAFNEKTATKFAKRFAKDFERFGYDIDSWKDIKATWI